MPLGQGQQQFWLEGSLDVEMKFDLGCLADQRCNLVVNFHYSSFLVGVG